MRVKGGGVNEMGDYAPGEIRFQNGFAGMRLTEMKQWAAPFVAKGAIPEFNPGISANELRPMLQHYEAQGYFGDDPWGKTPGEDKALAAVAKVNTRMDGFEEKQDRILALLEKNVSGGTPEGAGAGVEDTGSSPTTPPPVSESPSPTYQTKAPDLAALKRPGPVDLTQVGWQELRRLAMLGGLNIHGMKRPEMETALEPIMEQARKQA